MRVCFYITLNGQLLDSQIVLSCIDHVCYNINAIWTRNQSCFIWTTSWENLFMQYANNKGADQPVHPRSLISAFVVRCLDTCSIIPLVSISEISSLYLASVAEQAGLSFTWSKSPKTGFLVTRLIPLDHVVCLCYKEHFFFSSTFCTRQAFPWAKCRAEFSYPIYVTAYPIHLICLSH